MAIIVDEVSEIPKKQRRKRCSRLEIIGRLDDFMSTDIPFGLVIFTDGEYGSVSSAKGSLNLSAERYEYPLRFEIRANKLYFRRTDY